MRRNDNIYWMHAKDVCFNPKIQLPGINIEDTIDEWLDDDEDICDFQKNTKHADTKRSIALYALSQIHIEPVNTNELGKYRVNSVKTYILHTFHLVQTYYRNHASSVRENVHHDMH
jgi:hypothetical protein